MSFFNQLSLSKVITFSLFQFAAIISIQNNLSERFKLLLPSLVAFTSNNVLENFICQSGGFLGSVQQLAQAAKLIVDQTPQFLRKV